MTKPRLTIKPDDAFFILMTARTFDEQVDESDPDSGSNPADDMGVDILEARASNASEAELKAAIARLDDDALLDLVSLIWIGRGDFSLGEWDDAREAAQDIGRARAPRYVTGIPMVSDYLAEGLSQFGYSLEDYLEEPSEHRA